MPVLQIQYSNRGRYLSRFWTDCLTCPFLICDIEEFWNFWSPEEYSSLNSFEDDTCIGQDNKIDVWALGSNFYYLLSDKRMPFYYINNFDKR
jgi:hypothetical protein